MSHAIIHQLAAALICRARKLRKLQILPREWHADPLLVNDREISKNTTAVTE
jgi:hypothetical protein